MLDVGWPDPAAVLHRIESTRNCWASSPMSSSVSTVMAVASHVPAMGQASLRAHASGPGPWPKKLTLLGR